MKIYLDTSVIVAALTVEPLTPGVQQWLGERAAGTLHVSDWTFVEVASALSIKQRTGALTADGRARAATAWQQLARDSLVRAPLGEVHFALAAQFCARSDPALRAGDALHLAVAAHDGLALATLDVAMADAARAHSIAVAEVG